MSSFETRDNEEPQALQRRRDQHRANFLMCERNHDEDDQSFRQRLDDLTDKFREKRQAWSASASQTGSTASDTAQRTARMASDRTQQMFTNNPLVSGILAAAVGEAFGSTIPVSQTEQEKLGELGGRMRDVASQQAETLKSQALDKKDDLLAKADEKLQPAADRQQQHDSGSSEPRLIGGVTAPASSVDPEQSV
jgi:ElaB/YqjD/DUF883 family membrane-anchored ribosome-binding protein